VKQKLTDVKLDGSVIIGELIRNMEVGRFEMAYTVLLPCLFTVYLNPDDHRRLSGVFALVIDDARKALRAKVAELNGGPADGRLRKRGAPAKEHKIACRDWEIEFLPDAEVPPGDVEIHSELAESVQPGYRGVKTTLIDREPSVAGHRTTGQQVPARRSPDPVYAQIRYEDESGPQVFSVTQNQVRVGRGGEEQPAELALYTTDEVSRQHLTLRRDPASGGFYVLDMSTNGTWINGRRLRKGVEEPLPQRAEIGLGEVLKLSFEASA
jgi:hypothetical protein